jgi:hypothetical protein
MLYSPLSQWLLPVLLLVGAVLMTWSLLVANIWLGYSGRAGFYYSVAAVTAFVAWFFFFVWWLDHPRSRGDTFTGMLPWLPWALATAVTAKVWLTALGVRELRRRRLVSDRGIAAYACVWLVATGCFVLGACLMSPRIEWFRNMVLLAGVAAFPLLSAVAAPLAISWNRHR